MVEKLYEPPKTALKTQEEVTDWLIPTRRRIGRLRYISLLLGIIAIYAFLYPLVLNLSQNPETLKYLTWAAKGFIGLCPIMLAILRSMDVGGSPGWMLLLLVPYINIFYALGLLFWEGTEGKNMYGDVPHENHIYSVLLACVSLLVIYISGYDFSGVLS